MLCIRAPIVTEKSVGLSDVFVGLATRYESRGRGIAKSNLSYHDLVTRAARTARELSSREIVVIECAAS